MNLIIKKTPFFLLVCTLTINFVWAQKKPNILFIAIDDLRPELGCYGSDIAITPNIDALAKGGLLFNRAYCQQAICSPSRASLMTGARPESINVIENYTYFRTENPNIITLPQQFKNKGYETTYCGKIFHGKYTDKKLSWSRSPVKLNYKKPKRIKGYVLKENQDLVVSIQKKLIAKYGENAIRNGLGNGPAFEFAVAPDNTYEDGYNTDVAIATMKEMLSSDKPFFLGLGFKKPHLNWIAPKKYWDLYDENKIQLTTQNQPPINGAAMGLHNSFELRARANIPKKGSFDKSLAINLKQAYLACISYVDAQIGRMLKAMDKAGIRDHTIIVLWSDHGWHLGDMGVWGKATNYEIATRVPLIISTPEIPEKNRGKKTNALVELIDIYPTLCDLANLEIPSHVEGKSFKPLLFNPNKKWKTTAFSQYPSPALREWAANPLSVGMRETFFGPLITTLEKNIQKQQNNNWNTELFEKYLMGYSMRTDRYRLIAWKDMRKKGAPPIFTELFDHKKDPQETINIASKKKKIVFKLLKQLSNFGR